MGVYWENETKVGQLTGKNFCITGTLTDITRAELTEWLQRNGANVTGSVSSKTDYLICGEMAGSKLSKAEKLGISILDEAAALNFLKPLVN